MARLKNSETGVVVTTDDERAETLRGLGYEDADEPAKRSSATKSAADKKK